MNKCEYSVVCIISQKLPIYGISFVLVTYHDHTSSDTQSHTLTPVAPPHTLNHDHTSSDTQSHTLTPHTLTPSHPLTPSITINAGMVMFPGDEQWLAFVAREPIVRCVKSAPPMTLPCRGQDSAAHIHRCALITVGGPGDSALKPHGLYIQPF